MRLILLFAMTALAATPAFAADSPTSPEAAAEPPVCTTVTTVVKRGDVVLSTNSTTRCEEPARPGSGAKLHPGGVLAAPQAVLSAPASLFGSISLGSGEELRLRNAAGDWRVIYLRSGDICHLTLSGRTTSAGFLARGQGCKGELAQARAWVFHDGGAEVLAGDGAVIVRLTGNRDQLTGSTPDGERLTLQR